MRAFPKILMAVLIAATFSYADQGRIDTERIVKNIVNGLTHDNEGVIEGTIRVAILMKINYPNVDYDDIVDELEDLIMDGPNKNIRLKALIASDYLNNFEQYKWLQNGNYNEGDQLFDVYLSKMNLNSMAKI